MSMCWRPCCRFRPVPFVELVRGVTTGGHPDRRLSSQGDDLRCVTIEEESGTYTGPVRQHNGYYAGDFSRTPVRTAGELSALVKLRLPTFPSIHRNYG
jgi:hypothetical protein